jgi:hypothetical protein
MYYFAKLRIALCILACCVIHQNVVGEDRSTVMNRIATSPAETAMALFYDVQTLSDRSREDAMGSLRHNPFLPSYFKKRIALIDHRADHYNSVDTIVRLLSLLRTEWSAALLAEMLFDDRDMNPSPGISYAEYEDLIGRTIVFMPVREWAAEAFHDMAIPGGPSGKYGKSLSQIGGKKLVLQWRGWWTVNRSNIGNILRNSPHPHFDSPSYVASFDASVPISREFLSPKEAAQHQKSNSENRTQDAPGNHWPIIAWCLGVVVIVAGFSWRRLKRK